MCFYSLFFYVIFYCFQINFTHSSYSFATEHKYFFSLMPLKLAFWGTKDFLKSVLDYDINVMPCQSLNQNIFCYSVLKLFICILQQHCI